MSDSSRRILRMYVNNAGVGRTLYLAVNSRNVSSSPAIAALFAILPIPILTDETCCRFTCAMQMSARMYVDVKEMLGKCHTKRRAPP